MTKLTEKDIENYLVKQAKAIPDAQIRKCQWVGHNHCPDRLIMTPKITIWVEVKAPGETLRSGQQREHARMRIAGQNVYTVDSKYAVDLILRDLIHAQN